MKKTIKRLSIILSVLVVTNVSAKVNVKKYHNVVKDIVALEQQKDYMQAALKSANAANELASSLGVDSIVKSISTTLHENRQEVVVGNITDNERLSIFSGLIKGSHYKSYDVTKIITTNAEDVSLFDQKQINDYEKLQKNLVQYVKENEEAIIYAKALIAKSLVMAEKVPLESMKSLYPYLTRTALRLSAISFFGEQNIQKCLSMNYASTTNSESASISSFLLSLDLQKTEKNFAYSETSCTASTTEESSVNEGTSPSMDNLIQIDRVLKNAEQVLSLKLFTDSEAPSYPTWGSTYY